MSFDPVFLRAQFPILSGRVHGKPLIYLDNAASTQKPKRVLRASKRFYATYYANVHRGVHHLSQIATDAHEAARAEVARFVNASTPEEIIFTSGTTDSINLVSSILRDSGQICPGDLIILSGMEHHSNIVPWQMLCQHTGAELRVLPVLDDGTLDLTPLPAWLASGKVKVLSCVWVSNALGTVNPVAEITRLAKAAGALVIIDAAQAAPHIAIDVQSLNCDFLAFSGHKIYAPTGIGALWGRKSLLESLPPWKGGGEMIAEVTFEKTTYAALPFKYEAGTPNIEGGIAMAEAIRFMREIGTDTIASHERMLADTAIDELQSIDGLRVLAPEHPRASVVSIIADGVHHYDLGVLLDQMGIAVRTGHHCCQPLMARFGVSGTTRASMAVYNTREEVLAFTNAVRNALRILR